VRKLVSCAVAVPFLIVPLQSAIGACLSIEYDGMEDYWVNQCAVEVGVNWTDAGACKIGGAQLRFRQRVDSLETNSSVP